MDSHQAKEILARYRPGGIATDPQVGEALELARRDPQLAAWFEKHRATHGDTPNRPPPFTTSPNPGQPPAANADREHIIPLTKPALAMIGIAVAVLLGVFLWSLTLPKPKDAFSSYRDRMARLVQRSYPMKIAATDQAQIREYFRTNAGPVDITLPRNLEKLPGKGGAVFTWHNHPVSLLGLDAGGSTNLYLFVIKRSAFPNIPVPAKPEFNRVGKLMTASWNVGDQIYVLAGPGDEPVLRSFLE